MTYAVISIGNKQYRVREGLRLLVDRVPYEEGKTFTPALVMLGGDGDPKLGGELKGQRVTARVSEHVLGDKVVIGKHRRRTGYKRRNGFRARLSRIEIESIGSTRSTKKEPAKKEAAAAEKKPATAEKKPARKAGATAAKKAPARKSAPRKKSEE
ncbi:MAG TPA: 50S ribosomal protein L21 [Gaiellaceae bacterium]|nr:50S ribosomal protein L21 [Gaiellaceae bacterium]